MLIFAYGSLIADYKDNVYIENYELEGYERVLNATIGDGYVYYNLVENKNSSVVGDIIYLGTDELYDVILREKGYDLVNIGEYRTFISRNIVPVAKKTYIDKSK